ncbi:MAG: hypothetical protein RLZZ360_790 [Candidatus Parcubacteria bacterium]|jgi:hypothetical protein
MSLSFTILRDCGRVFSGKLPVLTTTTTAHEEVLCTIRLARNAGEAGYYDVTVWSVVPAHLAVRDEPASGLISKIWETTDTGFCVQQDLGNANRLFFVSSLTFEANNLRWLLGTVQKRVELHAVYVESIELKA